MRRCDAVRPGRYSPAMTLFWIGLAAGAALSVPITAAYSRRTARTVTRAERRAQAAERLAELGTLTGGLAHEIKNPLSTINLNVQLLQEDLRDIEGELPGETAESPARERIGRTRRRIDALTREIQRLKDILEDFLRFAGRVKLDLQPTDVNALIGELADFYLPQAQAAKIQIRTRLAADPPTAPADPALLKQAILNLMINATQAMEETKRASEPPANGGCNELIIRTDRVRVGGQEEFHLHVIDCGPGIPDDLIGKIFQPYFSTKRGGTGLGLPTARRIVEEHGGTISVHSEVGRGTDFTIALPTQPGVGKDAPSSL